MKTIYIRDADTTLAVDTSHFTLRSKGRRIGRIPPTMVEQVIVDHGVEITRTALDRLGTLGIPVTFLGKEGRVQARLVAPWQPDPSARLGQAAAWFDPGLRLLLSRRWIDAKLANCHSVLRRYLSNYSDDRLTEIGRQLTRHRDHLAAVGSIPSLLGVEGSAARLWFEALGKMLRTPWLTFTGRYRRPPADPGNAVLSYCYAVLANQLLACVEAEGLDPYVGCIHGTEAHRPSLVLDIIEPFRPALADRLMLRLLNLGVLKEEHFHQPDDPANGVRITPEGREAILKVLIDWAKECDEAFGTGKLLTAPGMLMQREARRYRSHAASGTLADFIPYHLDPDQVRW
jgi:CRISPR-associated protein Cas1